MELYGIDVSAYNPVTSYARVAASGRKVAILRVTERNNQPDPTFERNYKGFRQAGMKVGVYKFSYALSAAEASLEADSVLRALKGKTLEFPVFYDMEWSRQRSLPASQLAAVIREFRRKIVDAGYLFGIYCNLDWYNNVLDVEGFPYDYWIASYPYNDRGVVVESLRPAHGIGWQYSSKGTVPGIDGNVDLDVFYKDYTGGSADQPEREEGDGAEANDDWIKRLQSAVGAVPDNIPGPETLSKLPLLKEGSQGEVVRLLQERLGNQYRIGVTGGYDGIYGPGTRAAVMEFQKQKGLSIDGITGQNTWKALLGDA